jgi:ankyrin repeat protein
MTQKVQRLIGPALAIVLVAFSAPLKGEEAGKTEVDTGVLNARGQSIIFQRVQEEDIDAIRDLLDAGLDVDVRGFQGSTPAIYAAMADTWPVVLFLLEHGANPAAANRLGFTLPWLASTSRIVGDGPRALALEQVRARLARKGLMLNVVDPRSVQRLIEADAWPPAPEEPK